MGRRGGHGASWPKRNGARWVFGRTGAGGYKHLAMTEPHDELSADPLSAALEAVTRDWARRMSVRIDRLVGQAADLAALEEQIAALEGDPPSA